MVAVLLIAGFCQAQPIMPACLLTAPATAEPATEVRRETAALGLQLRFRPLAFPACKASSISLA
jgi:hypothetical protein